MRDRTRTAVLALILGAALGGADSRAEGRRGDDDDVRREVRQLKAQLQSLRALIGEAAELDRQRVALLLRASKGAVEAPAPVAVESPRAPSLPTPVAPSLPPARRRTVEVVNGLIRGKVEVPAGEPVAYVYVENVFAPAVAGDKVVIEQSRKQFVPNWAVIQRGTTVDFPNQDKVYHNVFSPSIGNNFDLGLYNASAGTRSHTFKEPGSVDLYCNIHPQMSASILVVPNGLYSKVRPDGGFEITDVPGGRRKVVAWAPGSRPSTRWVELEAGTAAEVSFRLEPKTPGHKNKDGQHYGSYE